MKTTIELKRKSISIQVLEGIKDYLFRIYCFWHTLFNHPRQMKKVYWSDFDCYIEIGKSGYISNGQIFDLNGDITPIRELVINDKEPITIDLSEPEYNKIKKLADEKHITIKDILLTAVDKLRLTE